MGPRATRMMVKIDQERCNGCGLCVPQCAEGAIQIIEGKARLVSESYCDGLGACLGHCPQDAITLEEQEVEPFDEAAARQHLSAPGQRAAPGCPSAQVRPLGGSPPASASAGNTPSQLTHWPVQLALIPPTAQIFQGADLLVAADCVPFAYPDFHRELLQGRVVVVGCPKLDETEPYVNKLAEIIALNDIQSITVAHMEVPCCFGLLRLVQSAMQASGRGVPLHDVTITVQGERVETPPIYQH